MSTGITDTPTSVTHAGMEFNYSTWTADTIITLTNVPWSSDYRHIVPFESNADFMDYIHESEYATVKIERASYVKPHMPVNVPIPYNVAERFNYIVVESPALNSNDEPRIFAYFINHAQYVNPNTTQMFLQVDAWQTYCRRVYLGRAYVERGHIGIAHTLADRNNGRDFLTVPEGLDVGGEYLVKKVAGHDFNRPTDVPGTVGWDNPCSVMVVSVVSFEGSGGTKENPNIVSARGVSSINNVPSGADVYFFETARDFGAFVSDYSDKPWITSGIIAAYLIPPMGWEDVSGYAVQSSGTAGGGFPLWRYRRVTSYDNNEIVTVINDWRQELINQLPSKYRHLTKLLTYPYTFFEVTMQNGGALILKPETLSGSDLRMNIMKMLTPPNPRLMMFPVGVNDSSGPWSGVEGEYLDFATGITNLPQVAITNNSYLNYLASNAHSLQFQHRSADWSQQRTMQSAQVGYEQATGAINANTRQTEIGVQQALQSTDLANQTAGYKALAGFAGSATTGLAAGAIAGGGVGALGSLAVGAASSAADYAISVNHNNASTAIGNNAARARTGVANEQAGMVRDTNLAFAQFAATGDYQNAVAGINAKVQDAQMIQPTTSGQVAGEAFTFSVMRGFKLVVKVKQIDDNVMAMIGDFWLRYGYAVNRYVQVLGNKLNVMDKFTYWKVKELEVGHTFGVPEIFRQAIRGIFEKGVTVWNDPRDIVYSNINSNPPKPGITL